MDDDQPPCGEQFEIESVDLIGGWPPEIVRQIGGVILICSRPEGHTPAWKHSDGVTDWIGDEER